MLSNIKETITKTCIRKYEALFERAESEQEEDRRWVDLQATTKDGGMIDEIAQHEAERKAWNDQQNKYIDELDKAFKPTLRQRSPSPEEECGQHSAGEHQQGEGQAGDTLGWMDLRRLAGKTARKVFSSPRAEKRPSQRR